MKERRGSTKSETKRPIVSGICVQIVSQINKHRERKKKK